MKRTAVLLSILLASPVAAQVYECDGTWTSTPCENPQSVATMPASTLATAQPEDPNRGEKSLMFHELTMKSIRAREEYDVKVELGQAERACVRDRGPIESCATAIKAIEEDLDRKILIASQLKAQQESVKAQEEANKLRAERNEIERSKPTVAVVRRPVIIVRPDTELRPQIGTGSSVQVQGSSPSGDVSISITENSGYSYPRPGYPRSGYPREGYPRSDKPRHDRGDHRYHQAPRAAGGQVVVLPKPKTAPKKGSKSMLSSE